MSRAATATAIAKRKVFMMEDGSPRASKRRLQNLGDGGGGEIGEVAGIG